MTQPTQQATNPPAQTGAVNHPILKGMLGDPAQAGAQPTGPAAVVGQTGEEFREVDTGNGVKRRVSVRELEAAYNERVSIQARKAEADRLLAEAAQLNGVRELRDRIEQMPPAQRARLIAVLEGQEPQSPPPAAAGDEFDDLFPGSPRQQHQPPGLSLPQEFLSRFETIEQAVGALAQHRTQEIRQEREKSVSQQVEDVLGTYPIFKDQPGAAIFARDAIMRDLTMKPDQPIERLVQEAAQRLQTFVQQRSAPPAQTPLNGQRPIANVPKGVLTGAGLQSGQLRRLANELLSRGSLG